MEEIQNEINTLNNVNGNVNVNENEGINNLEYEKLQLLQLQQIQLQEKQLQLQLNNKLNKKPFWSSKHIIYASGFPFISTLPEIKNLFCNCGEIVSVERLFGDDRRWNGCCLIRFKTQKDYELALNLNGTIWTGSGSDGVRYIKIKEHKLKDKKKKNKDDLPTIFIGNLPKEITHEELHQIFDSCGEIKKIRLAKDNEKKCRGFGHIEFKNKESRNNALELNQNVSIGDKLLTIRLATITTVAEQEKKKKRQEAKKAKQKELKAKNKKKRKEQSNNSEGNNNNQSNSNTNNNNNTSKNNNNNNNQQPQQQQQQDGDGSRGGKRKKARREQKTSATTEQN